MPSFCKNPRAHNLHLKRSIVPSEFGLTLNTHFAEITLAFWGRDFLSTSLYTFRCCSDVTSLRRARFQYFAWIPLTASLYVFGS